jgi:hypothetical protein
MYAGIADYRIEPVLNGNGDVIAWDVSIKNGKEYSTVNATFTRAADGSVTVTLNENDVKAFAGQVAAASTVSSVANAVSNTAVSAATILK